MSLLDVHGSARQTETIPAASLNAISKQTN